MATECTGNFGCPHCYDELNKAEPNPVPPDQPEVPCMDCGRPYPHGLDVVLTKKQWLLIHPDDGGVLCPSCIVNRAAKLGAISLYGCIIFNEHLDPGAPLENIIAAMRLENADYCRENAELKHAFAAPPAPSVSADFETWWSKSAYANDYSHTLTARAAWNASKAAVPAPIAAPSVESDERFEAHTKAVGDFLKEMYATMIDPVDDFVGNISELCAKLLEVARNQREQLAAPSVEAEKCRACGAWICRSCLSCSSDCGCAKPDIPAPTSPLVVTKGGKIMADQKAGLEEFIRACGRPVDVQDLRNSLKVIDRTQRMTECRVDRLDALLQELINLRAAAPSVNEETRGALREYVDSCEVCYSNECESECELCRYAEAVLAKADQAPQETVKEEDNPECSVEGCHHTKAAHCNLNFADGKYGCCYCLCDSYTPEAGEGGDK